LKGEINVIHLKVYGSVLDINVEENTSAVMLYNTIAAWMEVDPSSINIEICIVGKAVEGMGHNLTKDDLIWDGRYNFVWFKVKLVKKKMDIENYKFDPEENMDISVDLKTIKFNVRMNRCLKIASVEKIIEERFMKEYNLCPVFNGFKDTTYCREMKLELFEKETLKGYVLERKFILKKVRFSNGCFDVSIEDCRSIGQLKKKICKCYGLGKGIIIADLEKRVLDENLIIKLHPEDVWIYLNENGSLADVCRSKIEYEIILNGSVHNFMAVMFNAWNHRSVEYYINCLIGVEREVEIYLDGQIWTEKLCTMWTT
jgi:hypothetical protein